MVIPRGISFVLARVPGVLDDAKNDLPDSFGALILRLVDHFKLLTHPVDEVEE